MKVLFLSPGPDTAGLGIGMKRAFDACGGDWTARAVRLWDSPWHYPADVQWNRDDPYQTKEVQDLFDAADVIHIMERPEAAYWFRGWQRKAIVVEHLGTFYRRDPVAVHAACVAIGARECADMHDLMRFDRRLPWLPDVQAPLAAREVNIPPDVVRIAHAPTDRRLKSTDVIVSVVERLARYYPVAFDLIEGVSTAECIRRKAAADIFVDELTFGYGLNATECWAMGIPDVSGIANPTARGLMLEEFDGVLPFVEATADTLEGVLTRLICDPEERAEWGRAGFEHYRTYHSHSAVVERALRLYEWAMEEAA